VDCVTGVIDPARGVRTALQDAASVASILITPSAAVAAAQEGLGRRFRRHGRRRHGRHGRHGLLGGRAAFTPPGRPGAGRGPKLSHWLK